MDKQKSKWWQMTFDAPTPVLTEVKTVQIHFRATPEERDALRAMADRHGFRKVATLLRWLKAEQERRDRP